MFDKIIKMVKQRLQITGFELKTLAKATNSIKFY